MIVIIKPYAAKPVAADTANQRNQRKREAT